MKKFLLSLVLVLCLGLPGAAKALYTCQFGANNNQASVSNYTTTWQVKVGENTWSIANFNNNKNGWDYVRCGRKGIASVASITTDFAIAEAINTVEVTIDKITPEPITSIKLETSAAADFATIDSTVDMPADNFKTGEMVFTLEAPKANLYYRLTFDCGDTGTANGLIQISAVTYNNAEETPIEKVADIAAFIAKADKNPVIFSGNVEVIYQTGSFLFVKDNSGRLLIYGKIDQTYEPGDVIPGGFMGSYGTYVGEPQLTNPTGLQPATARNESAPRTIALSEITEANKFEYVAINGVNIASVNNRNITFQQGETTFAGYNQFYTTLPEEYENVTFNVTAIIGCYNGNLQVQPISIEKADSSSITEIGADDNAPAEYFNLQGIRVENPENGLFIRRQGNKVSKVIIR